MSDRTAAQTHVCYGGFTFYLVNMGRNTYTTDKTTGKTKTDLIFTPLPGGTYDNMQNPYWAGLSLDDLVISSFEGYMKNGMKNGYSPDMNEYSDNGILFGDGVRTPGFTSLPVCELDTLLKFVESYYDSGSSSSTIYPYFPCPY
jgi:hypothetical protein